MINLDLPWRNDVIFAMVINIICAYLCSLEASPHSDFNSLSIDAQKVSAGLHSSRIRWLRGLQIIHVASDEDPNGPTNFAIWSQDLEKGFFKFRIGFKVARYRLENRRGKSVGHWNPTSNLVRF